MQRVHVQAIRPRDLLQLPSRLQQHVMDGSVLGVQG
jgi:hypothetical protein